MASLGYHAVIGPKPSAPLAMKKTWPKLRLLHGTGFHHRGICSITARRVTFAAAPAESVRADLLRGKGGGREGGRKISLPNHHFS